MPPTASAPPTLYLIDGYGQFFRAYHAIRQPMSSPVTKEPTNMSFGFIGMLLKLLRGEGKIGGPPHAVAVAIDKGGDRETFRSALYPGYKATRQSPPDDFKPQVKRVLALLREIGVPVVGVQGYEADDVLATLVTRVKESHPGWRVRLVTKDKDLKQLLDPGRVEMFDVQTDDLITAESFRADCGLAPAQVVDMLALMGDTVDNIPGVPLIGPKTACELISAHGDLRGLKAAAAGIGGKRGENLRFAFAEPANLPPGDPDADLGRLGLNRKLVALRHDVPIDLDPEAAATSTFRLAELLPILRELGFNRYQDELKSYLARAAGGGGPGAGERAGPSSSPSTTPRGRQGGGGGGGGLFDALPFVAVPGEASGAGDPDLDYRAVTTRAELDALAAELRAAPVIAVDTETTSLSPRDARLCGLSFSIAPKKAWYVPTLSPTPERHLDTATVLGVLGPILEDTGKPKTGHNLKYDLLVLRGHGVALRGLAAERDIPAGGVSAALVRGDRAAAEPSHGPPSGFDSMVGSYLIDPSRSSHSLDSLALALLNHANISIKELIGTGAAQRTFDTVPVERATPYAAEDADTALRLRGLMLPTIVGLGLTPLLRDIEVPLVEALAELEWNGMRVDPGELERQRLRLAGRIEELKKSIQLDAEERLGRVFNPDSPKQLSGILFNKRDAAEPGFGIKPVRKTQTGFSTDNEVLEKLVADPAVTSPIPSLILDYRQLTKLVGTYLLSLRDAINPGTGRIHASFNQTVAATGRLSSSDPNLQNIPIRRDLGREVRRAFVAPPGRVLVSADYSQIELRLLAHLSKDPALTEAFLRGEDIHAAVAAQVYGVSLAEVSREQRNAAKMVNFGIVYGVTPWGLARRLGTDAETAAGIIDRYKKRFSGITTFLQECVDQARRFGYVETMLGRRRPVEGIDDRNPSRRALAERIAINSVVQGSAADMIKIAMVDLHARLSPHAPHLRGGRPPEIEGVMMVLQIHDELVFEAPEALCEPVRALVVERMEGAMTLSVPLRADSACSTNWFEGK